MIRYITFLLFFLNVITLQGQPYRIKRIGVEHGLSNNYIMSITQDRKGFLWFSTESGLNRFDGNDFRIYKKNISASNNSISGNELNRIYADRTDDIVWIATQREGLNAFDCSTETFTHYKHNPDDPHSIITNDVTNITNARDGNLWVTSYHKGFDYFDKTTNKFTHYNQTSIKGLASNSIWSIAEDKKGTLYIGHVDHGLSIFSPQTKDIKNFKNDPNNPESIAGNSIYSILIDSSDNIWLGTNNGLVLFNPITEQFTRFAQNKNNPHSLISNTVLSLAQLEDGKLWIGTENGGISILDISQNMFSTPENTKFSHIYPGDTPNSLSNKTVRSIFQDSFKNIWIGTYGDGINFISNRNSIFEVWDYSPLPNIKNNLSHKTAWGICVDENDKLWIGTDGGGIDVFDKGLKIASYNKENSKLSDNAILTAFKDSYNNLWFGTFSGGANILKKGDKNIAPFYPHQVTGDIRCFAEDNKKNIWMGGANGIYIYDIKGKKVTHLTQKQDKLRETFIRSIIFDNKNQIWIGSFGEGLSIYDSEMNLINYFDTPKGFPSNMINQIYRDKRNNIWVATGDGLVLFKEGKELSQYYIYNEQCGLENSHIRGVIEDAIGNIWLSTISGISQFQINENKFYNYSYLDGVPLGDFTSASVTKTSDGILYFGSHNGVCRFNPILTPYIQELPPVVITDFKIFDNKVELPESEINKPIESSIELAYNQNSFKVSFNVLDYSLNNLVEYNYMLVGLENIWYNSNANNPIVFRNIPYGSYELVIRSKIRNQEWADNITSLTIKINPPMWYTWWAKSIYFVLIILAVLWLVRFYKRRLNLENSLILEKQNHQQEQELHNERLRFFTNIAHELRTPLTLILGPLEDLHADTSLSKKHTDKISLIHKSASRLLGLVNQILEFRKTETQNKKLSVKKDNLANLVQEIGLKYKELNTNRDIEIETKIEKDDYDIYYDSDIINTILENLMSNAYKYTDKGSIVLSLQNIQVNEKCYTQIIVKDTGKGIHQESISKIFNRYYQEKGSFQKSGTGIGLALVNNLVKLHEGEITVESELENGTSFCFRIITNNCYPNAIHLTEEEENVNIFSNNEHPSTKGEKDSDLPIVLIIEDNEEINQYIVDSLSDEYITYSAVNGKDGIEKAYAHIPDIIISDIMMPEMDGITFTKIMKEDVRTSHIPIILLTAKDSIQDRTNGYSVGAESYITKPFSTNLLRTRITNLLDARRKLAEQLKVSPGEKTNMVISSLNELDKEFIERVTSIIHENIESENLDVSFIADQMFMSHSSLYRKLKALTDMSINEFIRKNRIWKSEQLLLTGKYGISEISYMVGISSPTYFRQCFKEEFGLAPTEYLKKHKGE